MNKTPPVCNVTVIVFFLFLPCTPRCGNDPIIYFIRNKSASIVSAIHIRIYKKCTPGDRLFLTSCLPAILETRCEQGGRKVNLTTNQ